MGSIRQAAVGADRPTERGQQDPGCRRPRRGDRESPRGCAARAAPCVRRQDARPRLRSLAGGRQRPGALNLTVDATATRASSSSMRRARSSAAFRQNEPAPDCHRAQARRHEAVPALRRRDHSSRGWRITCRGAITAGGFERNAGDTRVHEIGIDSARPARRPRVSWECSRESPLGFATVLVVGVLFVLTSPNRWGVGIAMHYLSRATWPDPEDPIQAIPAQPGSDRPLVAAAGPTGAAIPRSAPSDRARQDQFVEWAGTYAQGTESNGLIIRRSIGRVPARIHHM